MDLSRSWRARAALLAVVAAALTATAAPAQPAAHHPARVERTTAVAIDPAALPRGEDPSIAVLVRNTIRDGDLRIPTPRRGFHDALWVVAGGYVVRDFNVGPHSRARVVRIDSSGERKVLTTGHPFLPVAVSASGRRVAVERDLDASGLQRLITVYAARTGRVIARRELRMANLVAVTDRRVLLGIRARWHRPRTMWWDYERDRLHGLHDQAAVSADVPHDRVVFDRTPLGEFCNRVAPLSRPARTLWHSCGIFPHQWSPDGTHALATHTYFDAAGTDRWWVIDGTTARRLATIEGRLDWDAVWEDDAHFLTLAQSDAGRSAIIRCDLTGSCERASRLWDVPVPPEPSIFYDSPPVVLADR